MKLFRHFKIKKNYVSAIGNLLKALEKKPLSDSQKAEMKKHRAIADQRDRRKVS